MQNDSYFTQYQAYFAQFLTDYLDSGRRGSLIRETQETIAPYVQQDPTRLLLLC